jgi:hypothetical protein
MMRDCNILERISLNVSAHISTPSASDRLFGKVWIIDDFYF